jgi:hypothetical protein
MQRHTTLTKIRTIREQAETNEAVDDLLWMEQLAEAGHDEFVDGLLACIHDSATVDGRDERQWHRAMTKSGFATAYRF